MSSNECPKCGSGLFVVESSDDVGRPKTNILRCQNCGHSEVRDDRGKPMLTEVPPTPGGGLMTEG